MEKSSLPKLVLASASPRRRHLLAEHGYAFTWVPPQVEEVTPEYLTPAETVLYNARAKAVAIARQRPESLVLGVDTVVVFERRIYGKPGSLEGAFEMLRRLNGQEHEVYSGVWLCRLAEGRSRGFTEATRVRFRRRTPAELQAYLARIGPLDKAGAYAAQDDRGVMIREFDGSFTNVIGLPMERLAEEIQALEPVLS